MADNQFSLDTTHEDDTEVLFGTDSDFFVRYNSSANAWEVGRGSTVDLQLLTTRRFSVGDGTGLAILRLNGAAGNERRITAMTNGNARFQFGISDEAESGSNAGSNIFWDIYQDNGTLLDRFMAVARVAGSSVTWGRPQLVTTGAAAPATVWQSGATTTEGLRLRCIDEDVVFSSALASKDLTNDVPSGAVILGAQLNLDTAITATTAVKVGLGVAADPDKYGLTGALTQNSKSNKMVAWAVLSGAEDVQVYACDSGGAAAGTLNSGTVRVRLYYLDLANLDNT